MSASHSTSPDARGPAGEAPRPEPGIPTRWGATPAEIAAPYPCDGVVAPPTEHWFRAVTVHASPEAVYRWLCQLRVAPYSYDLVDNGGRRSPRALTPGLDRLEVGQRVMTIFELVAFEPGRHLTIRMSAPRAVRRFGRLAVTYALRETAAGETRLVAKLVVAAPPGAIDAIRRRALAWGDLVMMRKQLLNLGRLAERGGW